MAFLRGFGGGASPGQIGEGIIRIGANTSGLRGQVRNGVQQVKQELNEGAREVQASGRRWDAAFGAIGLAAKVGFIGVAGAIAASVGASIQFESSWAGVRKTVDASDKELAQLRQQFRDLAKEIPISVNELASIGETAGALGIPKQSILEFTKVIATIGQTTNVSTQEAATSLGQLSNVLKLNQSDYSRFASTLVDLGNKGASTESQILGIANRAGSAGALIKMSTQDVLAYSSAVASLGIEVEAGGSSLQNFFLKTSQIVGSGSQLEGFAQLAGISIDKFVAKASSGKKGIDALAKATGQSAEAIKKVVKSGEGLDLLATTAGMTGKAFTKAFEKDAGGALKLFIDGLGKLPAAEKQGVLSELKLNDLRITRTLLGLAGNTDLLAQNLNNASTAWKANTAAAAEASKRYETTSAQLGLLKNLAYDYMITLGDMLLPVLKGLVGFLHDGLPAAIKFLTDVWNNVLLPPVSALVDQFGKLGGAIGQAFGSKEKPASWGDVVATTVKSVANAVAALIKLLTPLVGLMATLVGSPLGGWALKAVAAVAGLRIALGLFNQVLGRTRGLAGGIGGLFGGGIRELIGIGGGNGPTLEKTPLDASAANLDASAKALTSAAGALKGGAAAQRLAGAESGATGALSMLPDPSGSRRIGNNLMNEEGQLLAVGMDFKDEYVRNRRQIENAGKGLLRETAAGLADGIANGARGLKAAGSGLKGLLSDGIGLVSKVFWPLMIAEIGSELLKEPLGGLIEDNTQFKRAGAKIKTDFIGGLADLVQSWALGSDTWVGRSEFVQIGSVKFKTMSLSKLGITNATFDLLTAPVGTIDHALGAKQVADQTNGGLAQTKDEDPLAWYHRVKDQLNVDAQKQIDDLLNRAALENGQVGPWVDTGNGKGYFGTDDKTKAAIAKILNDAVPQQIRDTLTGTRDELMRSLHDVLKGRGYSGSQIDNLSNDQLEKLGHVVQLDAEGKYGFMVDLMVRNFVGGVTQKTQSQLDLSKSTQAAALALRKAFGSDWQKDILKVLSGKPENKVERGLVTKLQKIFGDDWQATIRQVWRDFHPQTPSYAGTSLDLARAQLGKQVLAVQASVKDWLNTIPADVAAQIDAKVTASGVTDPALAADLRATLERQWHETVTTAIENFNDLNADIDPKIKTALVGKFGTDWETAFAAGTHGLTTSKKAPDKAIVAELARVFGPQWASVLKGTGALILEGKGGADWTALKKSLAAAITAQIGALRPKDFLPADKPGATITKTKVDADRKQVTDYINSATGQLALAAATSPDATKAKKGFEDIGKALAKYMPDQTARDRFVRTLVALQTAAQVPSLDQLTAVLSKGIPAAGDAVHSLGDGVDWLVKRTKDWLSLLHAPMPAGSMTGGSAGAGHGTGGGGGRAKAGGGGTAFAGPQPRNEHNFGASGLLFDTRGSTDLTVGEAGREHVAVLRNFRRVSMNAGDIAGALASHMAARAQTTPRPPATLRPEGTGRRVSVFADKLQLFTPGDARSVNAQLEFLAPDGR